MRFVRSAFGAVLGGLVGSVVGLFLAVPFASFIRGGTDLATMSAVVGALLGAVLSGRQTAGRQTAPALASSFTFRKSRAGASAPRQGPRLTAFVPPEETPVAEPRRDYVPTSPAPAAQNELNALLGRGSEFDGKLSFEGTVRVDGIFTGEISTTDTLIVGEGAKIAAEIACGSLIVHGEIIGNIRAKTAVELHQPARVHGDISTPSLMIERGVVFEGRTQMESAMSNVVPIKAAASVA